jgi:hypothetical protein
MGAWAISNDKFQISNVGSRFAAFKIKNYFDPRFSRGYNLKFKIVPSSWGEN